MGQLFEFFKGHRGVGGEIDDPQGHSCQEEGDALPDAAQQGGTCPVLLHSIHLSTTYAGERGDRTAGERLQLLPI